MTEGDGEIESCDGEDPLEDEVSPRDEGDPRVAETIDTFPDALESGLSRGTLSNSIARSSIYLGFRRFGILVMSLISTLVLARALGATDYGDLQSALATWAIILTFCDFGVSIALGREMAKDPSSQPSLLRATYWLQSGWAAVMALGLIAMALISGSAFSQHSLLLLVFAPSIVLVAFSSGRNVFLVRYQLGYSIMVDLVTNTIQVVLSVAAVMMGFGAVAVAVIISASSVVNSLWIGAAAHRLVGPVHAGGWWKSGRLLVRAAIPLGAMTMLSKVYLSIDLVLLGFAGTGSDIGNYAAAVKVVMLANIVPGLLVNTALPGVSANVDDAEHTAHLISRLLHWMIAFALPMFIGMFLYRHVIVLLLFGHQFVGADELLAVLSLAGLIGTLSQLLSISLIASTKMRALISQNVVAMVFNVGLNIALIPAYGALACAWITVGTECIVCAGSAWTLFHSMGFRFATGKSGRSLAVVALATVLGASLAGVNVSFSITVFVLSLTIGLVVSGCWPKEFRLKRFAGVAQ